MKRMKIMMTTILCVGIASCGKEPAETQGDSVSTSQADPETKSKAPSPKDGKAHENHKNHHHAGNGHHEHARKSTTPKIPALKIGEKVPDFEVTIGGKKWKLSELQKNKEMSKDGTLVLTFWCSFCHSCRHVEHRLDELAQHYRGEVGVIALDASAGETTEDVTAFAKEEKLSLPIAIDAVGKSADIFGVGVTTTAVVIDQDGLLRYRGQFADGKKQLAHDALKSVLAGKEVAVEETRQKG
jgi:thiol-disulfide isomerase/thioredoxin